MFGLMMKDMYAQKKTAYLSPFFLLLYFLTIGKDLTSTPLLTEVVYSTSIGFIAYFMVISTNFDTGEMANNQNRLLLSLPIKRRSVIDAKYVMISAWWLITYLSFVLFRLVINGIFHLDIHSVLDGNLVVMSFCFSYLFASIFYPIHYKFGFRVASVFGMVIFFLIAASAGKMISSYSRIPSAIVDRPLLSFVVLSLLVALVSYLLSLRIFTKKDF